MYLQNANGTNNSEGMIRYQIKLHLRIDWKNMMQHFFVLNLRKRNNIILGYPWLTKNNPHINWTTGEVHLIGTPVPQYDGPEIIEQWYLLWCLGTVEWDELEYATWIYAQQRNVATLWRVLGEDHPHIWKLTLSMALAQAAEKVEQKHPLQYAKYAKVFDEPEDGELPPWQPFDHGIDLKETFILKVAKTYPMNPKEMEACKAFIDKNLSHHKPLHGSSSKRRTEGFAHAKITDTSMNIWSKMPIHSLSSLLSSTNWK